MNSINTQGYTENSHDDPPRALAIMKFQVEAQHRADNAPPGCLQEGFPHIHIFHISCWRRVLYSEREIWPQALRHEMKEWFKENFRENNNGIPDLDDSSCTALAMWLLKQFNLDGCEVLEDGVAGAVVQKE